jgi:ribulose-phosphate 3-epimerase
LSWSPRARTSKDGSVAIAPSLLSADFSRLGDEIRAVENAGAGLLHLDVMDGHFVPNLTFGPMLVRAVRKLTDLPLDTHLMIENPDRYIPEFADAGSDIITIHIETCADARKCFEMIRDKGKSPGLTLNPDTPVERVEAYLGEIDLFLVMSVFPGFAGQSFMPDVLTKVERVREIRAREKLDFAIEIDGGINPETSSRAREAGADILVAGSAVFKKPDYAEAIRALRDG